MPKTQQKFEHLKKIAREFPEYSEVLTLFLEIYSEIDGREEQTGLSFVQPVPFPDERTKGGFPLFGSNELRVDQAAVTDYMCRIIDIMRRVGKEADAELAALSVALREGRLDLPLLFAACLDRQRKAVDEAAASAGVQSPLLEYILEVPLKTALELLAETVDASALTEWKECFCPVCGGRAGMAELAGEEGRRFLSCGSCSFVWPFKRGKCPYCGTEDQDALSYFVAGEGSTRVDVCAACSRYIKTRDSRKGNGHVPLEAEDLTTIHLDLLALKEGYDRGK